MPFEFKISKSYFLLTFLTWYLRIGLLPSLASTYIIMRSKCIGTNTTLFLTFCPLENKLRLWALGSWVKAIHKQSKYPRIIKTILTKTFCNKATGPIQIETGVYGHKITNSLNTNVHKSTTFEAVITYVACS